MNPTEHISPDDPRLTAFALGEMEPAEHAAFVALLQHDAAARAAVDEIRATVGALGAALEREAGMDEFAAARAEASQAGAAAGAPEKGAVRQAGAKVLRFPQLYYAVAGLAAACFAIVFVLREARPMPAVGMEEKVVQHVAADTVAPPAPPMAAAVAAARQEESQRARQSMRLASPGAHVPDQFFITADTASSSFPLRVGRDSYDAVRAQLRRGLRPTRDTVHVAEMINAFNYSWPEATPGEPVVTLLEETSVPWAPRHRLVRVGVKGLTRMREAQVRVDFNPARVRAWRLIGFERDEREIGVRGLSRGETLGAGDTVTALYEIVPADSAVADDVTLLRFSLRYRDDGVAEREFTQRLEARSGAFETASADLKFIAAVAAFGMSLRESPLQAPVELDEIAGWASAGAGGNADRLEFVDLLRQSPR